MISIIIVYRIRSEEFHELWKLTTDSINGLITTADEEFELILIDNASHDERYAQSLDGSAKMWEEMPHFSRRLMGFRQMRFEEHVSLAKAWNEGVHQADGEWIMPANNDIIYHEEGWMSRMLEPFEWSNEERVVRHIRDGDGKALPIGIVGIQHMSWYKFAFVEGSLFVFPKSFVEEFDLSDEEEERAEVFDERFTVSCEDVDFNERVQRAGYGVIQVNDPPLQPRYLQHIGHQTIQTLTGSDENFIAITHENRERLCEKWGYPILVEDR